MEFQAEAQLGGAFRVSKSERPMHTAKTIFLVWLLSTSLLRAADCARTSTGFPPLTDPFHPRYQGASLGLYPDGRNQRPTAHEEAGLRLAKGIQPLDASGNEDEQNGKIVFLSIGMSNTTQEFRVFLPLAMADPARNPRVDIVDGAQGGWSVERILSDGGRYWRSIDERLRRAGDTSAQVRVAWVKQANARPTLPFPDDARALQADLAALARELRQRFPNLELLYLSSRIYAGYASSNLNPEPFAYQSGFAVKWLIEDQINGNPELSYEAGQAPWLAWGPYLWADGLAPREDGLVWRCREFAADGTHPAESAREKVAALLLDFVKSDTTAREWFRRKVPEPPQPMISAVVNAASYKEGPAVGSIVSLFGADLAPDTRHAPRIPLPVSLAGVRVLVAGRPAYLYFVSARQINFVAPWAPAGGDVIVERAGRASESFEVRWTMEAPGIFTVDADASAAVLHADGRLVTSSAPARRGEILQLFLTGLGVRNPLLLRPLVMPSVSVGGARADIPYSGPAPGYPGLDQINFQVPPGSPLGEAVALRVETPPAASNIATLAVAK